MNIAYILRGLPGSGKSTEARRLAGVNGRIHSTDDYFTLGGHYQFDVAGLDMCHKLNRIAFYASLSDDVPVVVCDNTNVQRWEFAPYIEAAERAGYEVVIITMPHPTVEECVMRNTHGVPEATIRRMIEKWEE